MSVVLADSQGRLIGAITFERHSGTAFDEETLQLVEAIAALLGPIVYLQMRANRAIAGRIVDSAAEGITALLGAGRPALKLGAICAVALVLALAFAKGEHRVSARSLVEAGGSEGRRRPVRRVHSRGSRPRWRHSEGRGLTGGPR